MTSGWSSLEEWWADKTKPSGRRAQIAEEYAGSERASELARHAILNRPRFSQEHKDCVRKGGGLDEIGRNRKATA
jgi:hypothetical protein